MKTKTPAEDSPIVYQCALPVSRKTTRMVADLRGHLKKIRSPWRKLPPGRIAVVVLAFLRHDHRLADLAGGNDVSASTIRRWVLEVIALLAQRAPRLDRALKKITAAGGDVVLLDGTLVRTRRRTGKDNRKNYSGKHKSHGLLFLAVTDDHGNLVWISAARPGKSGEITTARHNNICARLRDAGLGALADRAFIGLDDGDGDDPVIITGFKAARNKPLTTAQKQVNQLISAERAANEHGFADLKNWRISPSSAWTPPTALSSCAPCRSSSTTRSPAEHPPPVTARDRQIDIASEPDYPDTPAGTPPGQQKHATAALPDRIIRPDRSHQRPTYPATPEPKTPPPPRPTTRRDRHHPRQTIKTADNPPRPARAPPTPPIPGP
ncbi:transposase family protein [Acrocarpospora sp. B8E8]|uniref:transposase family protein n=1 Tax=Acrocarpospora sp. B8E8 TaxID=3153572 RepID=UPI00325E5F4B